MSDIKQRTLRGNELSVNVTIPKRFAKELGLTPGNTVFWIREGNSLRAWFGKVEDAAAAAKEAVAA